MNKSNYQIGWSVRGLAVKSRRLELAGESRNLAEADAEEISERKIYSKKEKMNCEE